MECESQNGGPVTSVRRLLRALVAACALTGCSSTEPSTPHNPTWTAFDFSGRYVGGWNVIVLDTARVCSPYVAGCENPVLETVGCEVTTDFVMLGDRTFTGTFRIGPGGGPHGSGICNVTSTQWLSLALEGEIRAGTVDTVTGPQFQRISFNIGQGTRQDLERLFGCTLAEDWDTWRMRGAEPIQRDRLHQCGWRPGMTQFAQGYPYEPRVLRTEPRQERLWDGA
jgi:hypothetical protein